MNTDRIIIDNFISHHPVEAARILERLKLEDAVSFLEQIPDSLARGVFNQLDRHTAVNCLEMLGTESSAAIIEGLSLQVASVFLQSITKGLREEILSLLSEEVSIILRRMLNYPVDSAGAMADPLVLTLPEDITVKEALQRVQKYPEKAIYYLYILNHNQALTGVINIRELMLARPDHQLSKVMHTDVARLSAELNFQAILNHPGWQEYHALPVVEEQGTLLGAIPYKTLRHIERESKKSRLPRHIISTSNALGELYQIGLLGLIRSATTPFKELSEKK